MHAGSSTTLGATGLAGTCKTDAGSRGNAMHHQGDLVLVFG
jgi:hypothetical protein